MRRRLPLLVLPALLLGACALDAPPTSTAPAGGATTAVSPRSSTSASTAPSAKASASSGAAKAKPTAPVSCTYSKAGSPAKPVDPPPTDNISVTGTATLTMHMNEGDVTITTDRSSTPCTINSFEALVKQKYFDNTQCHRLTDKGIFVLQCGDPTGTGRGGPGYQYADELYGTETYPAGTVAMANAGPGTNGSQFFFVYQDSQLPPNYTVWGKLDEKSLGVITRIAQMGHTGNPGDGKPINEARIKSVTMG